MKEKLLLKIALAGSLIGLSVLFFISMSIKIEETPVFEIKEGLHEYSLIRGEIISARKTNKTLFLKIKQTDTIDAVTFTEYPVPINEGDFVEIKGEVDEYNGEKEILVDEIRIID